MAFLVGGALMLRLLLNKQINVGKQTLMDFDR